jgi:hypothetical protein
MPESVKIQLRHPLRYDCRLSDSARRVKEKIKEIGELGLATSTNPKPGPDDFSSHVPPS